MRKILITSALPYVNNVPHLGNIVGCVLSADVYSRYCKIMGYETQYICGTDEYGTATETKAKESGMSPKEICDKYYKIHKEIYDWFDIKFDNFGRTSDPYHTEIVQDIFKKCRGSCFEHDDKLLFCSQCNNFLADRFVEGLCPNCGNLAKGDQCDNCGSVFESHELLSPKCKFHNIEPEIRESKHIHFDLAKFQNEIEISDRWSNNTISVTKSWLSKGLKSKSITRDLKWGVPVPEEKFRDKTLYIWYSAPLGYISLTKDWKSWWQNENESENGSENGSENNKTELVQFMGKDNIPFHTIIFPSVLKATGELWIKPYRISSTEYLNYGNGKFSKSLGTGIFGDDVQQSGISSDIWRFYLMICRPEESDHSFTWDEFYNKINGELLSNFGNFINRVLKLAKINENGSKIDKFDEETLSDEGVSFVKNIENHISLFISSMEEIHLRSSINTILKITSISNKFMQDMKPWKTKSSSVMNILVAVVNLVSCLIEPFCPRISEKIKRQMNNESLNFIKPKLSLYSCKTSFNEITPIIEPITKEQIQTLKEKFG